MLYLVSTPIGNLGDLSPRAKEVLQMADYVACEDTRTSHQLFSLLGIKVKKTLPYHDHNADKARPKLLTLLRQGKIIALVSDAGTPLVSDPGYKLVRDCIAADIKVSTVPGANAVLSALQLSGLSSARFYFGGFLPPKSGARKTHLAETKDLKSTLIFYETPNRLREALDDILSIYGNRKMAVVREITKKFEETRQDFVQNLITYYKENGVPKGELVLVIDGAPEQHSTEQDWDKLVIQLRPTYPTKQAAALLAEKTGISKKQAYQIILDHEKNKL